MVEWMNPEIRTHCSLTWHVCNTIIVVECANRISRRRRFWRARARLMNSIPNHHVQALAAHIYSLFTCMPCAKVNFKNLMHIRAWCICISQTDGFIIVFSMCDAPPVIRSIENYIFAHPTVNCRNGKYKFSSQKVSFRSASTRWHTHTCHTHLKLMCSLKRFRTRPLFVSDIYTDTHLRTHVPIPGT